VKSTPNFPDLAVVVVVVGHAPRQSPHGVQQYCRGSRRAGDFQIVDNAVRNSSKSTPICIRMDDEQVKREMLFIVRI